MRKLSINELSAIDGQSAYFSIINIAGFSCPWLTEKAAIKLTDKITDKAIVPCLLVLSSFASLSKAHKGNDMLPKVLAVGAIVLGSIMAEDIVKETYSYMDWPKGK